MTNAADQRRPPAAEDRAAERDDGERDADTVRNASWRSKTAWNGPDAEWCAGAHGCRRHPP